LKIAVIPARGGSKRIPKKNIRNFHGKPVIAYSIEIALESALFDRVLVSTDDNEIAGVAREWGAEVPFIRPANISDDITGTNAVVKHTLQWFNSNKSPVDYACCIYATAPFLKKEFLQQGFNSLIASGKSFSFSVTTFNYPIQRSLVINENGSIQPFLPKYIHKRSQDIMETYHDAAQFYWGSAKAFLDDTSLFSQESVPIILPRHIVQDIDTLEDWKQAEMMYLAMLQTEEITK
jgi:pseudaminic acid cytidylyltransferase